MERKKFTKAELQVLAIESVIIAALAVVAIIGMVQIVRGSLFAVLYTSVAALILSLIGEDAARIVEHAKDRNNG